MLSFGVRVFCVSVTMHLAVCWAAHAFAAGERLFEQVDPARIPEVWKHLANERLMFPMSMANVAKKIGPERQLFLDNCLIASAENVTRQVHQPRRYEGNPVLMAASGEWVFALHVMQFDKPPRFRMWYWSMPRFYAWKDHQLIRNGTSYAVSDDGIHWKRPDLGLYQPVPIHSDGKRAGVFREKNVVMPYGMMHGLFYEPWEPDPQKRFKALVCVEALKKGTKQSTIREGYYLHTSPDGIHWKGDLENMVIPSLRGYTLPQTGIGDTSRFWWDSVRRTYIGDIKWVIPPKFRCRGMMESDDLVHWTRPHPTFFAREPGHEIYGHTGFVYQGMYIGFRWLYDKEYMNDRNVHAMDVELDCSRDTRIWTRVGAGQPSWRLTRSGTLGTLMR